MLECVSMPIPENDTRPFLHIEPTRENLDAALLRARTAEDTLRHEVASSRALQDVVASHEASIAELRAISIGMAGVIVDRENAIDKLAATLAEEQKRAILLLDDVLNRDAVIANLHAEAIARDAVVADLRELLECKREDIAGLLRDLAAFRTGSVA